MPPTLNILVSFNGTDGAIPFSSLIADANGDLFGTTTQGGANGLGTLFEIAKTASGYASTPTTLVNFNFVNGAYPGGSLISPKGCAQAQAPLAQRMVQGALG